jgi:hypothetical protein
MRSPLLLIAGMVALAAACGGQTSGVGGNTGGSRGGTHTSSGGSTGSNSGGSTSGSSSGADDEPDGGICPPSPFFNASATTCNDGMVCSYGDGQGYCGATCTCSNSQWQCVVASCPPPTPCPATDPRLYDGGIACPSVGQSCTYQYPYVPSPDCKDYCTCDPSGTWSCAVGTCSFPDAGPPDVASPPPVTCPAAEPTENSACPSVGNVCTYFSSCESNCLCTDTGWVCATESDCGDE